MLILLFISFIGFILSLVIHVLSIFEIQWISENLVLLMHLVLIPLFCANPIIKKRYESKGITNFVKTSQDTCPEWMKLTSGLLIIYSVLILGYSLIAKYYMKTGSNHLIRGFSGLLIAEYAFLFSLYYCARKVIINYETSLDDL